MKKVQKSLVLKKKTISKLTKDQMLLIQGGQSLVCESQACNYWQELIEG